VGALFDYHPPMLRFNRSEQRLLSRALSGATDEHLAETLGTSLPAVKRTWVSIYREADGCLPELISDPVDQIFRRVAEARKSGAVCWRIRANIPKNCVPYREVLARAALR
jgi:hypothetical protein